MRSRLAFAGAAAGAALLALAAIRTVWAERAYGAANAAILRAAKTAGNNLATGATWPTDHSFNDRRIALSRRLVSWLGGLSKSR